MAARMSAGLVSIWAGFEWVTGLIVSAVDTPGLGLTKLVVDNPENLGYDPQDLCARDPRE